MPLRAVGPTGRRLDLEQKSSFMDGHSLIDFAKKCKNICYSKIKDLKEIITIK